MKSAPRDSFEGLKDVDGTVSNLQSFIQSLWEAKETGKGRAPMKQPSSCGLWGSLHFIWIWGSLEAYWSFL